MQSKLQGAELIGADLREAFLLESDLRDANLLSADAEKARLNGANLQGTNLSEANFQCADFRLAKMFWVELYDYKWETSKGKTVHLIFLRGANFQDADLQGTRLEGARLTDVLGLTQEQLDRACVNEQTSLPAGLVKPKPCTTAAGRFVPETQMVTPYSALAIASLQQAALGFVAQFRNF